METCDISLVKQEIVELIKTEPQNELEFDTCGQSEIKTEDESDTSNSVHEYVKPEIYDSSLGFMDSNINHFTMVDNSEPATQNKALRHHAVISRVFLVADWMSIVAMQWFTTLRPLLETSDVSAQRQEGDNTLGGGGETRKHQEHFFLQVLAHAQRPFLGESQ
uniref:Uncharacterized protein n=1 Tax=Timema cristinae TaxID=61476 RepID=A0A7R9CU27_TIMCR|nr:unnamed protein product [Timema cristinae]